VLRTALIALGSNLGDRRAAIAFAADRLSHLLLHFSLSDTVETDPVGDGLEGQPRYLNAVASGETTLEARALLDELLQIERDCGRTRPYPNAPRTLDLDLILLGDQVIDEPGLQLPHPRFRQRLFVLAPAAQVAPHLPDPVTKLTIGDLLRLCVRKQAGRAE
jgi:2-amino-4-hydroxy-6-hydroxymethyldihydropteridine diphosphokinase